MNELLPSTTQTKEHTLPEIIPTPGYEPTEAEKNFTHKIVAENAGLVDPHDPHWVDHTADATKN